MISHINSEEEWIKKILHSSVIVILTSTFQQLRVLHALKVALCIQESAIWSNLIKFALFITFYYFFENISTKKDDHQNNSHDLGRLEERNKRLSNQVTMYDLIHQQSKKWNPSFQ